MPAVREPSPTAAFGPQDVHLQGQRRLGEEGGFNERLHAPQRSEPPGATKRPWGVGPTRSMPSTPCTEAGGKRLGGFSRQPKGRVAVASVWAAGGG